jgi:hypothetical protein
VIARKAFGSSCLRSLGVQASTPTFSSKSGGRCVLLPRESVFGRIFDRRGWDLSHLSYPLGGSLLGFEQLPNGHRMVDVVFGVSDLFAGDQEPHIGVHQVLRSSATSRVKLRQGDLRCGQAPARRLFHRRLVSPYCDERHWLDSQTKMRVRLSGTGLAQCHEQQFDTAGDA